MNSPAPASSRTVAATLRIYRILAAAFPQEFRNVYGDELLQVAEDSAEHIWRRHGIPGLIRLVADIAIRVPAEYLAELRRDLRHGMRMLAASPGFTAVALISLSLGIGIATCAYSEVNGLLRDLPGVPNPGELVGLQKPVSYPAYEHYRDVPGLFAAAFAYVPAVAFAVSLDGPSERSWGHVVTPSYFPALGIQPHMGRFFQAAEETSGQEPVVVVSHRFWESRLGGDPLVVGKHIRINGHACTVIGVGPEKFLGPSPALFAADLWMPASTDPRVVPELQQDALKRRDLTMFQMVGRLRPGISETAAEGALNTAAQQLADLYGDPDRQQKRQRVGLVTGGKVLPLRKHEIPFFKQFLMVLGSLLLLIACANIASMMLVRAADRRKEIAVRLAMGASRARLVRQLLAESMLLAAAAAPLAFLFSTWIMGMFSRLRMPFPIPIAIDLTPDRHALAFTFAVTALTGVLFGLVPALQATRTDLVSSLKEGGAVLLRRHRTFRLRHGLMLGQMAASLMLLLMTGYLGLGIQSTMGVQEGFNPRNLYLISVDPVRDGYQPERAAEFLSRLLERVQRLPGVTAACLTDTLPAALDGNPGVAISVAGEADGTPKEVSARKHMVGRGYFETAEIPILSGRAFGKQDEEEDATAVIVTQEAVRRFWNGENPVGRRIEIRNAGATGSFGLWPGTFDHRPTMARTLEVVGVAGDVSENIIAGKKAPALYLPLRAADYARPSLRGVTLLVRGTPGVDVLRAVRREISAQNARVTPFNARSMNEHIAQFMSILKSATWTYGFMGIVGLVLAAVGLAGVTAHAVARRRHEIGIRVALGARRRNILGLVMKEGVLLVAVGTAAGMVLALAGIRVMSRMFFAVASVQGYDPILLVGAPALLAALALIACYVPARRSLRIDPAVMLRVE